MRLMKFTMLILAAAFLSSCGKQSDDGPLDNVMSYQVEGGDVISSSSAKHFVEVDTLPELTEENSVVKQVGISSDRITVPVSWDDLGESGSESFDVYIHFVD